MSKINIISFNARSIRNKLGIIMSYLTENNIHLAFIQETWLRKSDGHLISEIRESGYNIISYRKSRRLDLGGGVALIHQKDLKIHKIKTENYSSFEHIIGKVISFCQSI